MPDVAVGRVRSLLKIKKTENNNFQIKKKKKRVIVCITAWPTVPSVPVNNFITNLLYTDTLIIGFEQSLKLIFLIKSTLSKEQPNKNLIAMIQKLHFTKMSIITVDFFSNLYYTEYFKKLLEDLSYKKVTRKKSTSFV